MRLLLVLVLVTAACSTPTGAPGTTTPSASTPDSSASRDASTTTAETPAELPAHLAAVTGRWSTDFTNASIDLEELLVGIPAADPRDLIPPLDDPRFDDITGGDAWLEDQEPGILVEVDGEARFYPLAILTRHEIVNDRFGDQPVVITYCPLCNTAVAFDPTIDGVTLRFGVSGLLRNSDLVMWDDHTQSLWQQVTGEAIVGTLTGTRLATVGSAIVRWADFRAGHPDGEVLSQDTGFSIAYGANPYVGYSTRTQPYSTFFRSDIDDRFPALERVVGVSIGDDHKAYPFSLLAETRAVNDSLGGLPIAVLWGAPDTSDALDSFDVALGAGIGTGVAYFSTVAGEALEFEPIDDDTFRDSNTGSTWTLLGHAIDGPLKGSRLQLAPHRNEFWFAWQAFFTGAEVWEG